MKFVALLLCLMALSAESVPRDSHFLSTRYINQINARHSTWKAGSNFHPGTPLSYLKFLVNDAKITKRGHSPGKMATPFKQVSLPKEGEIPAEFDARKEWGAICPTIKEVLDQGSCGSSWAVAAAAPVNDRICIATNGQFKERLSVAHLLYCEKSESYGCFGGNVEAALEFIEKKGLPTGGVYGSNQGCEPYNIPPSDDWNSESGPQECPQECTNSKYTTPLKKDLKFCVYKEPEDKFETREVGYHAAKLFGWGVENGTSFWWFQNSWGKSWGDDGYFKIYRGDSSILEKVYAADAKL